MKNESVTFFSGLWTYFPDLLRKQTAERDKRFMFLLKINQPMTNASSPLTANLVDLLSMFTYLLHGHASIIVDLRFGRRDTSVRLIDRVLDEGQHAISLTAFSEFLRYQLELTKIEVSSPKHLLLYRTQPMEF